MTIESRSVRVLQVVAAPVAGAEIGVNGPERRAANVVEKWAALGIEPVIAYPRRGRLWETFAQAGVPLVDFEIGSKFDVRRIRELARLAAAHQVDLIHTQGPGSLDAFAAFAGRACGIPVVVTRPVMIEHLVNVSHARRQLYGRVDRMTLRLARRVIAVSDAGRRHLQAFGHVPSERLDVVYNGVDLRRFAPRPARDHDGRLTIGMVAQLTSAKGWEDFIALVEGLVERAGPVHAKIIGDGPLRGTLETLVRERRLEDVVEFVGHRADVERVLHELDVFVLTSHREGLSMAVLEAMASGLPVIATDVGGAREQVVDGVNGFITRVGDVADLVARAELLAGRELRERFGRASRQRVEAQFSETAMVDGYAQAYRTAVGDAFRHRLSA